MNQYNKNTITMDQWLNNKERRDRCGSILSNLRNTISPEKKIKIYGSSSLTYSTCQNCTYSSTVDRSMNSTGISTPF